MPLTLFTIALQYFRPWRWSCHPRPWGCEGEREAGRLQGCRPAFKHGVWCLHLPTGWCRTL